MSYAQFLEDNDQYIPCEDNCFISEASQEADRLENILHERMLAMLELEEQWLLEHDNSYANGLGRTIEDTPFTHALNEIEYIGYLFFEEPYIDNSEQ